MEQGGRNVCRESLAWEEGLGHRRMVLRDWGCQQEETGKLFSWNGAYAMNILIFSVSEQREKSIREEGPGRREISRGAVMSRMHVPCVSGEHWERSPSARATSTSHQFSIGKPQQQEAIWRTLMNERDKRQG